MITKRPVQFFFVVLVLFLSNCAAEAADVFVRFRMTEPQGRKFRVTTGGFVHVPNWYLPAERIEVEGGAWSRWVDLRAWPLHGRLNRVGGTAEWPAMRLEVRRADDGPPIRGCALEVQLADKPDPNAVVIAFTEKGGLDSIDFLLPHPLREKKAEFETASQMTARHLAWAKEASAGHAPAVGRFDLITSVWGHRDPALARQTLQTLKLLGFNVTGGVPEEVLRESGQRTYGVTWHLVADPVESAALWAKDDGARIARSLQSEVGRRDAARLAYYVVADEIQTMDFRTADAAKLNRWFRDYLRAHGETEGSLGRPIDTIAYPAKAMYEKTLPRQADLPTRRILYHAAKFGQWWSVKQLRHTTDLVKQSYAAVPSGMKTETLPSDHSFFDAWGPPHCGMGYRGLDLFEIGAQEAVDILSAEDWLGLNRMYGPSSTWTGAQAFGYFSALLRSGIEGRKVSLRALITPSDDGYLRLKAYSALGQGAKSFFFWTFGPTYIGTENYWSDLRSEYDGIAKLARALEKSERVLYPARTVRDPVALLYPVSHDLWHTDDPAAFVENRLSWIALRHLGIQPDLLREEDVEAGRLAAYKVLYINGQCLTRKAAAAIDQWVRGGGIVYLSCGAATRDEFYEPAAPPFAAAVWPDDAANKIVRQSGHRYNERVDLPNIKPMTKAVVNHPQGAFEVKVIGYRLNLRETGSQAPAAPLARFADGGVAGACRQHGQGSVYGFGFLGGLAYSPIRSGQTTLDETWGGPEALVLQFPLLAARERKPAAFAPATIAQSNRGLLPVEVDLLTGPEGSALVFINHTYKPIANLRISARIAHPVRTAASTEGVPVRLTRNTPQDGRVNIELPLVWTDIVLLDR